MTADSGDEHVRWSCYRTAMASPDAWATLKKDLEAEPDPAVASSAVLRMLERLPVDEHESWIRVLAFERGRDVAQRRSQDLRTLNSPLEFEGELDPDEWSDWLQRRMVEQRTDPPLLDLLSRRGRTKRVRNAAAVRLRTLRK
ncbi:hypothetical protein [Streptomyces sp. NPDC052225]|uniref:hypothetical protein n=1 Tax=Streptomyces sp. NPDC052225 TaxID=3154949 RepID=UPI00343FA030